MGPSANILHYFPERQRLGSPASTWSVLLVPTITTVVVGVVMGIAWGALSGFAVVGYLWIRRFLRAHGWTPQDER